VAPAGARGVALPTRSRIQQRQRKFLQGENHKELEQALDRLARRIEEMMADDEAEWEARVD
jgi:hypothetical protein